MIVLQAEIWDVTSCAVAGKDAGDYPPLWINVTSITSTMRQYRHHRHTYIHTLQPVDKNPNHQEIPARVVAALRSVS